MPNLLPVYIKIYTWEVCHSLSVMFAVCVQELNSKAESKFHKLKTQAKNKIASLSKEVEGLRAAKGEESPGNLSALVNTHTHTHTLVPDPRRVYNNYDAGAYVAS